MPIYKTRLEPDLLAPGGAPADGFNGNGRGLRVPWLTTKTDYVYDCISQTLNVVYSEPVPHEEQQQESAVVDAVIAFGRAVAGGKTIAGAEVASRLTPGDTVADIQITRVGEAARSFK